MSSIGSKIGEGNTAEVYLWGNSQVLKLFKPHISEEVILHEFQVGQIIQSVNINIPKAFKLIKQGNRKGIIYKRIEGNTFINQLVNKPWKVEELGREFARQHFMIHKCTSLELPSYADRLTSQIQQTKLLSTDIKSIIIDKLEELPDAPFICHGDYHPDNLIFTKEGWYVIDWLTAVSGNPLADVARTKMILLHASIPKSIPSPIRLLIRSLKQKLAFQYIKEYIHLTNCTSSEITQWEVVVSAARLSETIPNEEKDRLLHLISLQTS